MTRYGSFIVWDTDDRGHAWRRGYKVPRPEFFSVAGRLRAIRRGRR